MKILLVEDEKEIAKSILEFIARESYLVDMVFNVSDAEEKLNLNTYDCALID